MAEDVSFELTEVHSKVSTTSSDSKGSEVSCRICMDSSKEEELVTPCLCKGTVGKVHISCLEQWLGTRSDDVCDICHFKFTTIRRPRYQVTHSIRVWLFNKEADGNFSYVCPDFIIFIIWTPLLFLSVYIFTCLANDHNASITPASWATFSLTLFSIVLSSGYYLWLSLTLRRNVRRWYVWWQRNNIVEVLSPDVRPQFVAMETSFV